MENYLHRQFNEFITYILEDKNSSVPASIRISMEDGNKFILYKGKSGKISIHNTNTRKADLITYRDTPRVKENLYHFFLNKTNWMIGIESLYSPDATISKILRRIEFKVMTLHNNHIDNILSVYDVVNSPLLQFIVNITLIPTDNPILMKSHKKVIIGYYENDQFDLEDIIEQFA